MKIPRKKKKIFRRIARVHFLLTLVAFGFYLSLSFFLGPKFLLSDMKEKFHVLADDIITVTARVLGPPAQPVVTATPVCVTGAPRVNLDWADNEDTDTWSIERDAIPLVSGLALSYHADATVNNMTTYSYVVTAHGPMGPGFAVSDPVSATTLDCPTLQPTPVLTIVSFQGDNIGVLSQLTTTDPRPIFTGTTNIPNAIIDILANGGQVVADQVTANGAGYWEWTPAVDLDPGDYTLSVTATDPLDLTRTITDTLAFVIEAEIVPSTGDGDNDNDGGGDRNQRKKVKPAITAPSESIVKNVPNVPLDFSLRSDVSVVYQGDPINVSLEVLQMEGGYAGSTVSVLYDLMAPDGRSIAKAASTLLLTDHAMEGVSLTVPLSVASGDGYRVRATLSFGKYSVTREVSLTVLPLPILRLGAGVAVTLPQIVAFSGWIALVLLSLLLLWLFLFIREYWLYLHAWRHVTERQLIRLGFFGTRKGVSG